MTLWSELYAEYNLSDAPEAEYSGFGGAIGCDYRPGARLEMGAWATYRLRPWVELFSSVAWESSASTIDGNDYSWRRVGGGVKAVFENELGTK